MGGGDLAGQFYDAGLLDELIVQIGSVTLGSGKPLLPRQITSPPLKLLSVKQIGSGFVELVYKLSACGRAEAGVAVWKRNCRLLTQLFTTNN